jgi:integral membrane protein (TIGR01906 family)
MKRLYFFLFLLNLPILLISLNVLSVTYDLKLYDEQFEEHQIYQNVGDALVISESILQYFSGRDVLNETQFSERELTHLREVKALITFIKAISVMSLLLFMFIIFRESRRRKKGKDMGLGLIIGGLITNLIVLVFLVMSAHFSSSFLAFHKAVFPTDTWLLPANSTLISLYPEGFFFSMFTQIILRLAIVANIIVLSGLFLLYKEKIINKFKTLKETIKEYK